ncbi:MULTISPECIES: pyrroloquinoline quinone biosynthesis peptide chaperone PqqD [Prauserella salsuginis group]|uniref:Pyrroloquinoline quinone biosynthesis protein D n=2 Tax=Prauserella salsuginis group TaxID=2893672 RepID=A0A839XXV8_9PSEU|nr:MULTISPECIES: pyrroloquinoline quinone biosynthesis peptide chaperone PqqD [Prauserella salsuginis group]MBB3664605.1 pyrroloquinoline quinone biosynthesis protein D [Prauserella sediminis]MCR3722054.1 pyrroloquinoline quinone biosynthesis protein D [Prauserella flava]MCR3736051.1 pyrroloquinoline quinone biosynthesis protein D [Prauserella salsuginis]
MTPRLCRGVRLTYDHTRQTHVLLFPEGVLMPNATAAAVLELCDGERTVPDIAAALGERYAEVREDDVGDVLARLVDRRVVEWA